MCYFDTFIQPDGCNATVFSTLQLVCTYLEYSKTGMHLLQPLETTLNTKYHNTRNI